MIARPATIGACVVLVCCAGTPPLRTVEVARTASSPPRRVLIDPRPDRPERAGRPSVLVSTPFDYQMIPALPRLARASGAVDFDRSGSQPPLRWLDGVSPYGDGIQAWCPRVSDDVKRIQWEEVDAAKPRVNGVTVRRVDASLDASRCSAKIDRRAELTAVPILPRMLYGYREAIASNGGAFERLVLVGPRAVWVGSTSSPKGQLASFTQGFTRIALDVRRGGASSAHMNVTGPALAAFGSLQGYAPGWTLRFGLMPDRVLQLAVEIAWPQADDQPTMTVLAMYVPTSDEPSTVDPALFLPPQKIED